MGDLDANYVKIGRDLEEYSEELNPQVEVKRDIGGNPNVSLVGYEVQSSVATYYAEIDDPMFTTLFAIANRRLTDDSCKTTKVDVLIDEMGNQLWAYREECLIVPVSVGGDTSGVQIPFNVYNMGNRTYGTFSFEEKEFTPSSGPEPSAGGILPLVATSNGTYTAPEKRAYSPVIVDVPTNYDISELTVVDNGTYTAPEGVAYDPIVVEVPVPQPATNVPLVDDGQGSIGVSDKYAREDHAHPLNVDSTNPSALGTASPGVATTYARRDHVHGLPSGLIPSGGTEGQALVKVSNSDYDADWEDVASSVVIATITIPLSWTDSGSGYYTATPTIDAVFTSDSKIDLQPDMATIAQLRSDGVEALFIENNSMALTAYAVGNAPSVALSMQCTVTESEAATPPTPTPINPTIDAFYPIGSIYLAATSIDPNIVFGGTWVRIKDTFLLASGDTYAGGTTGGEAEHTLNVNEMPSHTHKYGQYKGVAGWSGTSPQRNFLKTTGNDGWSDTDNAGYMTTLATGDGEAHNNMPPYLAIWVWQRTA